MFSIKTLASLAQLMDSLAASATDVLVRKHLGFSIREHFGSGQDHLLEVFVQADADQVRGLVEELAREPDAIRADAPTKYVFDGRQRELLRWLLHDGWLVEEGALVRVTPAAEEITGVRDRLIEELESSGLDQSAEIRDCLEDSSSSFVAEPPNFNDAITKVRIALETVARRSAQALSERDGSPYPEDSWGRALAYLRSCGHIDQPEEEVLARVYTFISPGAHVPVGVTLEEWARLARTYGLSSCYFLLKKYLAA